MKLTHSMTWQDLPPIKCWPGEAYNHINRYVYDVDMAVKMIMEKPQDFQFGMVHKSAIEEQIQYCRSIIDTRRVNAMSAEDAVRPLLVAVEEGGAARLIDGYHRATRCILDGQTGFGMWALTFNQTKKIRSPFKGQTERI